MDSLCQIKATVTLIVQRMENLPFLSKNDQPSQSRNGPPSESDWPQQQQVHEPLPRVFHDGVKDPLDFLRGVNPIGLILIGIVIGTIIISMRPIVINGAK